MPKKHLSVALLSILLAGMDFSVQASDEGVSLSGEFDSSLLFAIEQADLFPGDSDDSNDYQSNWLEYNLYWRKAITERVAINTSLYAESAANLDGYDSAWIDESYAEIDELNLEFSMNLHEIESSVTLGRQSIYDDYGWWWDMTLDAVVLSGNKGNFKYTSGIGSINADNSTRNDRPEPSDDGVYWAIGSAGISDTPLGSLTAFALIQQDRSDEYLLSERIPTESADPYDADLYWYGLRVENFWTMNTLGSVDWQINGGFVKGKVREFVFEDEEPGEDSELSIDQDIMADEINDDDVMEVMSTSENSVIGWAIDTILNWQLPLPYEPMLTLQYASGSGTKASREPGSRSWRQPGSQDYGEFYSPELTNMIVTGISLSLPVGFSDYVTLSYHRFEKRYADGDIGSTGLASSPNFNSRELGSETSLLMNLQLTDSIEALVSWSAFNAGTAYDTSQRKTATLLYAEIAYYF